MAPKVFTVRISSEEHLLASYVVEMLNKYRFQLALQYLQVFFLNPLPGICLERKGERSEGNIDRLPPFHTPTGNRTCNLGLTGIEHALFL